MPTRRQVLAAGAAGLGGCIDDPGRRCPGATVRLSLDPVAGVEDPLPLPPAELSTAANAVVETAIEGAHVERCVVWDGDPGPSAGLREVGERVAAHADVELAGHRGTVETGARREGDPYRLELVSYEER